MKIRYHAHHLALSGYGRAAAGYIQALESAGVQPAVFPVVASTVVEEPEVDVAIYHTTPAKLKTVPRGRAKKHVAITTWETSKLPLEHIETLRTFDQVIFPSQFCASLFHSPTARVVPHAFDPGAWPLKEKPPRVDDVFTFYAVGAWGERKNMVGLLKAYLHSFRKSDRTRLILIIDKVNFRVLNSIIARSFIPVDELPGLLVPDQRLSDGEIHRLHVESDCFVSATRGEGFGLPHFEALAMGKPIITPLYGGHSEFLKSYRNTRPVWHSLTPVFPEVDSISETGEVVTLPRGANCSQLWAEPSLDRLSFELRFAREEASGARDLHDHRATLESQYDYVQIGEVLKQCLNS